MEVLTWPRVESTPLMASSPDLISIHLEEAQGKDGSVAVTAVKTFAKVYLEAPTICLTLPLVTAHWAIVHGWAEPHYLASRGLMEAGTVLLYTPRDENELEVCHFHFSRAYECARQSVEMKQSMTLGARANDSVFAFRETEANGGTTSFERHDLTVELAYQ